MYRYHCLNPISQVGLEKFPGKYENTDKIDEADAILVRSADMHAMELPEKTTAVARAGAGVNNIPIDALGKKVWWCLIHRGQMQTVCRKWFLQECFWLPGIL